MSAAAYVLWVFFSAVKPTESSPIPRLPVCAPIPLGNLTALQDEIAPLWVPSAMTRGTSDILWSSLVTISLCVYTAVHINVPKRESSKWPQYRTRAKWTVIGIFAPEVVLFTALDQFWNAFNLNIAVQKEAARKLEVLKSAALREEVNNVVNKIEASLVLTSLEASISKLRMPEPACFKHLSANEDLPSFTIVQCFFVIMGGLIVDIRHMDDTHQYFTLTPEGVFTLARKGYFLYFKESNIRDKSKANVLAKSLVCLQVLWMLTQCVARKIAGLPLTLLEIHTFVHVFCALLMYAFWIKKPLNINEATIVTDTTEEFADITALFLINRRKVSVVSLRSQERMYHEVKLINFEKSKPPAPASICDGTYTVGDSASRTEDRYQTLSSGDVLEGGLELIFWYLEDQCSSGQQYHKLEITMSEKDRNRWLRAGRALKIDPWCGSLLDGCLCERANNFDEKIFIMDNLHFYSDSSLSWLAKALFVLTTACYGGIHASAWNFLFPSSPEMWLWRSSSVLLAASGLLFSFVYPIIEYAVTTDSNAFGKFVGHRLLVIAEFLVIVSAYPLTVAVAAARLFIVVESFISLRWTPVGVYAAIPRTNYIPHI